MGFPEVNQKRVLDEGIVLDPSGGVAFFHGQRAHEVEELSGERFSLVFFVIPKHELASAEKMDVLRRAGFKLPTPENLASARAACGTEGADVTPSKRRRVSRSCKDDAGPDTPDKPRYLVSGFPNLGLGLRLGRSYSEAQLRQRCHGTPRSWRS